MTVLDAEEKSQFTHQFNTPPQTPPEHEGGVKIIHSWPEPETEPECRQSAKRRKTDDTESNKIAKAEEFDVFHQEVLLLHGPKQRYVHTKEQEIPSIKHEREMLVSVEAIGLNPIDWKAP